MEVFEEYGYFQSFYFVVVVCVPSLFSSSLIHASFSSQILKKQKQKKTVTTVGYGDFTPSKDKTRVVVIILLLIVFISVPVEINRVVDILQKRSRLCFSLIIKNTDHNLLDANTHTKKSVGRQFRTRLSRKVSTHCVDGITESFVLARVRFPVLQQQSQNPGCQDRHALSHRS